MPDGRFLSKSIAYSAQVGSVSLEADYLFMRMIPHLDSSGRIVGEPSSVKALCCPLRKELDETIIARCLNELNASGLITWYEVKGARFVEFPKFADHQRGARLEREATSRLPGPRKAKVRTTPDNGGVTPPDSDKGRVSKVKLSEVKLSEVKLSEVKRSKAGRNAPRATPERLSWLSPVSRSYESRKGDGTFPWPKAGRLLKPLHEAGHSGEEIGLRLGRYIDWLDDPKYLSLAKFRETFGDYSEDEPAWLRQLAGYPEIVDEYGCFTEYGNRVTDPKRPIARSA